MTPGFLFHTLVCGWKTTPQPLNFSTQAQSLETIGFNPEAEIDSKFMTRSKGFSKTGYLLFEPL